MEAGVPGGLLTGTRQTFIRGYIAKLAERRLMRFRATPLLAVPLLVALAACGQSPLVGKWRGQGQFSYVYEFLSSGDYTATNPRTGERGGAHKYEVIETGRVKMEESMGSEICNFAIAGKTLTISGCQGHAGTYTKV